MQLELNDDEALVLLALLGEARCGSPTDALYDRLSKELGRGGYECGGRWVDASSGYESDGLRWVEEEE